MPTTTLSDTQRSIFYTWWNASGRYILDPTDPNTIRILAESSFAEGVQAVESKSVTEYETRYGDTKQHNLGFAARQRQRRERKGTP